MNDNDLEKTQKTLLKNTLAMYREGLIFGSWGNLSCKLGEDKIIITPSALPYDNLQYTDMVVVDLETGTVVEGKWKPSSELPLHLAIYKSRRDVQAIVHTHSIFSSAFAVARQEIPVALEELAQLAGGNIPVAKYALPGSDKLADNAAKTLGTESFGVLLANHGLITVGEDLEAAAQRSRVIERNAQVLLWSNLLGTPGLLEKEEVKELRRKFLYFYGQHK